MPGAILFKVETIAASMSDVAARAVEQARSLSDLDVSRTRLVESSQRSAAMLEGSTVARQYLPRETENLNETMNIFSSNAEHRAPRPFA